MSFLKKIAKPIQITIVNIISRNFYLVKLCRQIVKEYDNDCNCNIEKNGESLVLKNVAKFSNKNSLIIDIGCNTGNWSKTLSKYFALGNILCIDINIKNIEAAKKKLKGIKNLKFFYLRKAISDRNGAIKFFQNCNFNDSPLDSLFDQNKIGYDYKTKSSKVDGVKLDDLLKKTKYNTLDPLFIKADVEGNELAIMKGSENLFKDSKFEFFQFEFGHAARAARVYLHDIVSFIEKYDYKIFIIKKNGILPLDFNPFIENRYSMINLLAIKKSSINKMKNLILKR